MTTIRTGRASVNMLEPVQIEAYGSMMPINHVATLHVPEPAMITVQPFDVSQIGMIDKAIRNAGLGLNPSNDGKIIRIPIPPLNEERRKELAKKLHVIAEEHRVALRNVRRDSNEGVKKLLKDKLISEDEDRRAHDEIQKLTDGTIAKLDALSKAKEKDILEVK
jgi:ribosome recycling factor